MDDEAALRARRVAMAAAAWLNAPVDVEAYRRLVSAVVSGTPIAAPQLAASPPGDDEVLDDLGQDTPPQPLGVGLAELEARLRRSAREAL